MMIISNNDIIKVLRNFKFLGYLFRNPNNNNNNNLHDKIEKIFPTLHYLPFQR